MADSTPLDKLEIEITSSSDTAVKKVNALAAALERLGNVASLRGVEDTAEKIKSIGNASETISVKVDKTSERSLNSLIGKVKALQQAISSVNATAINIPSISKNDGGNKKATEQKVPQSISAFGTTGRVSETIQEGKSSAEALKNVKQNADDATASIRKMRKELSSQWSTWSSLGGMVHGVTEKVKDAAAANEKFSKALRYIIPVVGVITTAFRGVVSLAGKLWSVAKRIGSAFLSLAKTIASGVVGGIKKLGSGLKTIGKGVLNYVTKPFKLAMDVIKKWKNRLLSVAFYRTVRTALKMITDGFKEGIENLYLFSQEAGTQFAPTMDRLAASSLYLKNSLGALAAPLIQAVAPAVQTLINMFVDLLNVINAAFAALTGQSSYTKALYHAAAWGEDLSDSMGGAAASAKEFKRYLIGIDELNVMPEQSEPGGGGGGGSNLDTGDNNFEIAEVPSDLTDLAKKIKDAIAAGDWPGAGKILAEKFNSIIDSIDTASLGTKIGEKVQGGLEFFMGLVDNLNIEGLGGKLSTLLSNAMNEIKGETIGGAMAEGIKSAFRFVEGFVQNYDGPPIGKYLADVVNGWFKKLSEVDENGESTFTKAGKLINKGINGIITGITDFINGLDSETIKTAFNQFFGEIKWGEIWDNLKTLAKTAADKIDWKGMLDSLWTAITNIAIWIRDEILGISDEDAKKPWDSLKEKLENSAETITWTDALEALNALTRDIITTLIDLLPKDGWGDFWSDMKDKLATALGAENWEDLKDQLKKAMKDVWGDVMDSVYEAIRGQSGLIAGVLFPHRDEIDDAIEQYKKDFEKHGEEVANVNLSKSKLTSDEQSTIKDLYKRTGGEFTSTDVLSEQAWQGDFKIKVQAVVDKINTSSLSEEDKFLAMTALLKTVNDGSLAPEYRELVMNAVVQTVDSTALKDNQKSLVFTAILNTVNDTKLTTDQKTLIMQAIIDAVDDGKLSPESKKILMDAELTGIIDAIKPKKKVVKNGNLNVNSLTDSVTDKGIKGGILSIGELTDTVGAGGKNFFGGNLGVSTITDYVTNKWFGGGTLGVSTITDGVQDKTINNGNLAVNTLTDSVVDKGFGGGILSINTLYDTVGDGGKTFSGGVVNVNKFNAPAKKPTFDASARFTTYSSGFSTNPTQNVVAKAKKYTAFSNNPTQNVVAKAKTFTAIKKNPTQNVVAKATSLTNGIKSPTISVAAKITSIVSSATNLVKSWLGLETGGIYAGGQWQPIAGYASGGNPRKARLFYANENGMPELVGRIGGNTAVMNNGQIVASVASGVYRAVSAAMGGLGGYFASISNSISSIPAVLSNITPAEISPVRVWQSEPSYAQVDVTARNDPRYSGADGMEERIRESNEDMINALYAVCQRVVTAINEKDTTVTLDGQEVGRSVTREQNRMTTMYGKRMVEA